jgi:hypothetical protein
MVAVRTGGASRSPASLEKPAQAFGKWSVSVTAELMDGVEHPAPTGARWKMQEGVENSS